MTSIDTYITEKLHLRKDNDSLCKNSMEAFIDSFDDDEDKKEIVHLIKRCLHEIVYKNYDNNHWCYITKPKNEEYDIKYMWSSNDDNIHFNVGDKTQTSSTVLFIVKKGDEIPSKYKDLSD